jgi:NAD(P)-dependent dehydrogenase (short-subunit alcohol dehydrogenase family)
VNNAGFGVYASTLDHTKQQIEELFSTNVVGIIYMTQAVLPHMPSGGRIINISSSAAKLGMPMMPIYGATKAAMDTLSYSWAAEVRPIFFLLHMSIAKLPNSLERVVGSP